MATVVYTGDATAPTNIFNRVGDTKTGLGATVTAANLAGANVLVFSGTNGNPVEASEITAIANFVNAGGTLFVVGEFTQFPAFQYFNNNGNQLLAGIGAQARLGTGNIGTYPGPAVYTNASYNTSNGITGNFALNNSSNVIPNGAQSLAEAHGATFLTVESVGLGKVFVIGDNVNPGTILADPIAPLPDTTAPSAPVIDLVAASDSGASSTDNITDDSTPTFTATAEAGSTVRFYDGTTLLGTATETSPGNFSFTSTTLTEGARSISARATDAANNESGASAAIPVTIDTTAPAVTSVAINSATIIQNSTLNAGDVVSVRVEFSEAVIVTGTPQLALDIGGTIVQANHTAGNGVTFGSGTSTLQFIYQIQAGQNDANGISIPANAISLNGGTITDAASNVATLTHDAAGDNAGFMVDTTAPAISSIAVTSATGIENSTLNAGDTVSVTVTFSETVYVSGTPSIVLLDFGGLATYASGSGSNALVFTYTILEGENDANGISIFQNSIANGVITDAGGNIANLTHAAVANNSDFKVDTAVPTVVNFIVSDDGAQNDTLGTGDAINITVLMSESVTVTGTPQLALDIGGTIVQANYISGSGTGELLFSYTILAGQMDPNGISFPANALSLNGGTITDPAQNPATLAHVVVNTDYMVDTTEPPQIGGSGTDTFNGSAADNTYEFTAANLNSGDSINGGDGEDTLELTGTGPFNFSGVTISNVEHIVFSAVGGMSFFGNAAAQLAVIDSLLDGGAIDVTWTEGGATNVASAITSGPNAGGTQVVSTDAGGNGWSTSTVVYDASGNRVSKTTTMDDGRVITRSFTSNVLVSEVTTNIPGAQDSVTALYDSAGRVDRVTVVNDNGSGNVTNYDDAGRVDSRTITNTNGFATTSNFNDANQRTSVVSDDTASNAHPWQTSTLTFDVATGKVVQKVTVNDDGNTVTENYNASGQITSRVTTDGGANEAFTSSTQHFTAGVFQWQATVYDNNTGLIQGSPSANTINQSNGISDAIIGSGGADVFVFDSGMGKDRILDLQDGLDLVDLTAMNISSLADLSSAGATLAQSGGDIVINFGGGDILTLKNFQLANFTDADFTPVS